MCCRRRSTRLWRRLLLPWPWLPGPSAPPPRWCTDHHRQHVPSSSAHPTAPHHSPRVVRVEGGWWKEKGSYHRGLVHVQLKATLVSASDARRLATSGTQLRSVRQHALLHAITHGESTCGAHAHTRFEEILGLAQRLYHRHSHAATRRQVSHVGLPVARATTMVHGRCGLGHPIRGRR